MKRKISIYNKHRIANFEPSKLVLNLFIYLKTVLESNNNSKKTLPINQIYFIIIILFADQNIGVKFRTIN